MDRNDRFLNKVHASVQMGWGKKPLQRRPDGKADPVEENPLDVTREEIKRDSRMDIAMERGNTEERKVSLPRQDNPIPQVEDLSAAGKNETGQSMVLRLEDLKLHDWVNGTGEPVDPERKRMAGLKLNEKDMR